MKVQIAAIQTEQSATGTKYSNIENNLDEAKGEIENIMSMNIVYIIASYI